MKNANSQNEKIINFYKSKAVESFMMCIEIYNKPTINYRLEGSVFFLCNAWELLLKAKLLSENKSIYYPEKNGVQRTISLSDSIAKVMTNEKDPIRINLKVIIGLRNTATHSIIPEFEILYTPFLSFCVKAFADKIYDYFNINVSSMIKNDFLSLFNSNKTTNQQEIFSKYGEGIANLFENTKNEMDALLDENEGSTIAQRVEVNLVRINSRAKADFSFYASNNSKDQNIKYVDKLVDYNISHPLTHHGITNKIDEIIKKNGIPFTPIRQTILPTEGKAPNFFTTTCFDVLSKEYRFKENNEYCIKIQNGLQNVYKYSDKLVTFVIALIEEDKDIVIKIKNKKS